MDTQSKPQFRISLIKSTTITEAMVLMAAKANGGTVDIKLGDLETIFKGNKLQYPSLSEGLSCTLSGNKVLVDYTDYKGETTCALEIEEVELLTLSPDSIMDKELFLVD